MKNNLVGRILMPTLAAAAFLVGAVLLVATLTWEALPAGLKNTDFSHTRMWIGLALLAIAAVAGFWTIVCLRPIEKPKDHAGSDQLFTRYLIGLGYFLFVDAVLNMIAFAGFARAGQLDRIFPLGDGGLKGVAAGQAVSNFVEQIAFLFNRMAHTEDPFVLALLLILSLGMTLLGALFYFANSLWAKFKDPAILFNRNVFWGGLWFRLAEAIVFTIAVFLYLQFSGYDKAIKYLPMIGLFIGMTVKSSEMLVFGLANRLLASISALVAPPQPPSPPPPPPGGAAPGAAPVKKPTPTPTLPASSAAATPATPS